MRTPGEDHESLALTHYWIKHTIEHVALEVQDGNIASTVIHTEGVHYGCQRCGLPAEEAMGAPCMASLADVPDDGH